MTRKNIKDLYKSFSELSINADTPQKKQHRGYKLESLLTELFEMSGIDIKKAFSITGEQIDGAFMYKNQYFLIEAKWKLEKQSVDVLDILRGKVERKGEGAKRVFISMSGYTDNAPEQILKGKPLNLILLDGDHIWSVLREEIALTELLDSILEAAYMKGINYFKTKEIITNIEEKREREWQNLLIKCQEQVKTEIKMTVRRKYMPELYVNRKLENRFEQFIMVQEKVKDSINKIMDIAQKEGKKERIASTVNKLSELLVIEDDKQKKERIKMIVEEIEKVINENINNLDVLLNMIRSDVSKLQEKMKNKEKFDIDDNFLKIVNKIAEKLKKVNIASEYFKGILSKDEYHKLERLLNEAKKLNGSLNKMHIDKILADLVRTGEIIKKIDALLINAQRIIQQCNVTHPLEQRTLKSYIKDIEDVVTIYNKKCFLIIDRAGSGKTNLLCDIALRYAKYQPTIFITGQVNLTDEFSVERYIKNNLSEDNTAFREYLANAGELCKKQDKHFLIIIDGINENRNVDLMKRCLNNLLSRYSSTNFKICISCRDIYWSFFNDDFWKEYEFFRAESQIYVFSPDEYYLAREKYFQFYKIKCTLKGDASDKCMQPLLLRFFCEAYRSAEDELVDLGTVDEIRLHKLFADYWKKKLEDVRKRKGLLHIDSVEDILYKIAMQMRKDLNRYLPYKELKIIDDTFLDRDSIYLLILDEDIIIEEQPIKGSYERKVLFVYDEFMEYVMAKEILRNEIPVGTNRRTIIPMVEKLLTNSSKFISIYGVIEYLGFMLREERGISIWEPLISKGAECQKMIFRSIRKLEEDKFDDEVFGVLKKLSKNGVFEMREATVRFLFDIIINKVRETINKKKSRYKSINDLSRLKKKIFIIREVYKLLREMIRDYSYRNVWSNIIRSRVNVYVRSAKYTEDHIEEVKLPDMLYNMVSRIPINEFTKGSLFILGEFSIIDNYGFKNSRALFVDVGNALPDEAVTFLAKQLLEYPVEYPENEAEIQGWIIRALGDIKPRKPETCLNIIEIFIEQNDLFYTCDTTFLELVVDALVKLGVETPAQALSLLRNIWTNYDWTYQTESFKEKLLAAFEELGTISPNETLETIRALTEDIDHGFNHLLPEYAGYNNGNAPMLSFEVIKNDEWIYGDLEFDIWCGEEIVRYYYNSKEALTNARELIISGLSLYSCLAEE